MGSKQLLVCDLDNTLYDWVDYFVPSFYAMVEKVVEIIHCDREKLLDDIREVHQKYGDSEQPYAILEAKTIRNAYNHLSNRDIVRELDPAFHAFNSSRRRNLKLHEHVKETFELLQENGIILVAHTESKLFGVVDRLRRLEISQYFSKIYCRERSVSLHPETGAKNGWFDTFPMERVVELSHHQTKPNPDVLREICTDEGVAVEDAAYIGDSVARDMLMAKRARVFAIWAAYGAQHSPAQYDALVRISHWTAEEVAREKRLNDEAKEVRPDYVARSSFAEVVTALEIK